MDIKVVNQQGEEIKQEYKEVKEPELGSQSITTNIPKTTGRETGAGVIATNSGTTATLLAYFDYMAVGIINRNLTR